MRDSNDHWHLIIDPETAPTVKLVFDLASNGLGMMRISKYLVEHKIPIPRVRGPVESEVCYYCWGGATISKMLHNPVYKGNHVVCKCHQKAIRSNAYDLVPRDQWEIVENCHEAIVSREQWTGFEVDAVIRLLQIIRSSAAIFEACCGVRCTFPQFY